MQLKIVLTLGAVLLTSCISPLLEHVEAGDNMIAAPSEKSAECELEFEKSGLCSSWSWEKRPAEEEMGEATLRFWSKADGTSAGPYVDPTVASGAAVTVKLFMPSMGHGSSPVTVTQQTDAAGSKITGIFTASKIYFSMPGEWEIRVQLKKGSQVLDQAIRSESI